MNKITLHDAPPAPTRPGAARKFFPEDLLAHLRQHPGKWALGGNAATTSQANYWRKKLAPEGFKIVTRKREDDGTHDYWITYAPEGEA